MCGILGFSHTGKSASAAVLSSTLRGLGHRGPDHEGQFVSDDISMGAVRLSILDIKGGNQPMSSPDGDVILVFNGEIFNYRELRGELETAGYSFQSNCDTEVVLKAFLRWGTASFARLRGMFAAALWIQSEGRLILARDRSGIKPLYYCLQDGQIYFGSELKVILGHPQIRRHLSLDALNCFLSLNYVPSPFTLVEGIQKLLPGHFLNWTKKHWETSSYLPRTSRGAAPRSLEEATEELDFLLADAVREQLVSDVPVGIWLSGGLDSSTVLHYAAQAAPRNLQTFSISFRGQSFDESPFMAEISNRYGFPHSEFDLNPQVDLVDAIEQIAYYSDEPSADAGALPVWFLAKMTRPNATVVLTGEGSDELFAGYLTYKADMYSARARKLPAFFWKAALSMANLLPVNDEKIGFEYKVKRFLRGVLMAPEAAHVFWNGTFTEQEKKEFFRFSDPAPLSSILNTFQQGTGIERFLEFDQRYYLPDDILYKVDRMSMAHSVEVRPPFLDPRIIDFAAALPQKFKLNGKGSKYVLRHLMADKLPASVLRRPKIGFDIPIHQWLRGVLKPFLLDTLSTEAVSATGLFFSSSIERLIDDHLQKRRNLGYHLWGLIVLLTWMRRWNITLPETPISESRQSGVPAGLLLPQPASSIS